MTNFSPKSIFAAFMASSVLPLAFMAFTSDAVAANVAAHNDIKTHINVTPNNVAATAPRAPKTKTSHHCPL